MTSAGRDERDDREDVDRAFAELIAGYHLTAEPRTGEDLPGAGSGSPTGSGTGVGPGVGSGPGSNKNGAGGSGSRLDLDSRWADEHPLFSFDQPPAAPEPEPAEERYEPPPPPPWPRPSAAVLVGWLGLGFALVIMVAAALGVSIPRGLAWTAIGTFVGGFTLLLSRLPRHRPPSSGDGAVL